MAELSAAVAGLTGFKAAGVAAGIKKSGALDFALIVSETPAQAAAVFTTNLVKAAPLIVDAQKLAQSGGRVRAIAVNSGCANAATGQQGIDNALETARWVAEALGCSEDEVLVMSTGVIGQQLPMERVRQGVARAVDALGDDWEAAARAIMTTDTRHKLAAYHADGFSIAGMAKGAGMIAPNMATMLSFIVTDAHIDAPAAALKRAADRSFNRIVIDGDMSTNDTVLLLANGARGAQPPAHAFQAALDGLSIKLAQDIVRDGEGVTKFATIQVIGAASDRDAWQVGNTIATSPLVKTALYGCDANWGRIIAAAGRAGVPIAADALSVWVAPGEDPARDRLALMLDGTPQPDIEEAASAIMREPSLCLILDCGVGAGEAIIWTSDLSHEYVSINADYRT